MLQVIVNLEVFLSFNVLQNAGATCQFSSRPFRAQLRGVNKEAGIVMSL